MTLPLITAPSSIGNVYMDLFTNDELALAFERVRIEHQRKSVFVANDALLTITASCRTRWLDRLKASLDNGTYVPTQRWGVRCRSPLRPHALVNY